MQIREFLPNPIGKDVDGEYVLLFNDGREAAAMAGWRLQNNSGKQFVFSNISIAPGGTLKLPYSATKLNLKNTGETVSLFNPAGKLIDQLSYAGTASEGRLITHNTELTEELKAKLFTNLPEEYPKSAKETLTNSPWFFMMLAAGVLAGISVWIIKKTVNNNQELGIRK